MKTRLLAALPLLVLVLLVPVPARAQDRAVEIALRSIDAIESGWALGAYDASGRVRAAVNLRGPSSSGATANVVLDRANRRWRLDAAGDVGPLTLLVAGDRATLHVPGLRQSATRSAGDLAAVATAGPGMIEEIRAMRERLRNGYAALAYRGEETIDGAVVHRIDDAPGAGVTASYWIDGRTWLPRRVTVARPGRTMRIEFAYGAGPRPTRVDGLVRTTREVRLTARPAYDGRGRVSRLALDLAVGGGPRFDADVTVGWDHRTSPAFFTLDPPAGTQTVPFNQLLSGVLLQAAGTLGPLAQALLALGAP